MPHRWPPAEREPTPDERLLWRMVTRDDVVYEDAEADLIAELLDVDDYATEQAARPQELCEIVIASKNRAPATPAQELVSGSHHNLDSATARKLKRGQIPVDMILDLHGSSQIDAQERFAKCLVRCIEQKKRLLLVITGKGNRGGGVLRQMLPRWINEPHNRPYVLAFRQASVKDGAGGAFYVLLKRSKI